MVSNSFPTVSLTSVTRSPFFPSPLEYFLESSFVSSTRMPSSALSLLLVLFFFFGSATAGDAGVNAGEAFDPITVPAFPVAKGDNRSACHLDLSDELFGGVGEACARGGLDRSRCCPVLAAWLFAAHARYALEILPTTSAGVYGTGGGDGPMMPDDNQKCVELLHSALEKRGIRLPRANGTCDTVLCFCGIRLHQIGSLRCPAAFNVSESIDYARNATPTAAVRQLESVCLNASYAGCSRCLHSLEKVKGHDGGGNSSITRATRMMGRDCQLMGLTWLLARNRTAYIPTASAVLRAVLYSAHQPQANGTDQSPDYKCSPDQENMPLAVDSLQFHQLTDSSSTAFRYSPLAFASVIFSFLLLPSILSRWFP